MQFVPLWDSILDNIKLHRLGPEIIGKWSLMLVCAQRNDRFHGTLPDIATLSFWLRRSEETVQEWLSDLVGAKLVDRKGKAYTIHDWDQWRCTKDPGARGRMQRMRAKAKETQVTSDVTPNVTAPVTDDVTAPVTDSKPEVLRDCYPPRISSSSDQRSQAAACEEKIAPPLDFFRSPEDQKDFDQAVSLLGSSLQTEGIAMELSRNSDLSEVQLIEGWRWLNAARVMGSGAKKRTYSFLLGIARQTTREEFEAYGKASENGIGHRKPDPQTNMPVNAFTDPPDLAKYEAAAKAAEEEFKNHPDIVELRRRRGKKIDL